MLNLSLRFRWEDEATVLVLRANWVWQDDEVMLLASNRYDEDYYYRDYAKFMRAR